MQTQPPSFDLRAVRLRGDRSQRAFRTLMDSLSRPGTLHVLDDDVIVDGVPSALVLPLAIADVEVSVAVLGDDDGRWARLLGDATGARVTDHDDADCVAALAGLRADHVLALRRGSAFRPEHGARLVVEVDRLTDAVDTARLVVEVQGPGVPGALRFGVDGLAADAIAALNTVNAAFPAGVDTWLVDTDGRVVALPRSSTVNLPESDQE
ncbi:MAG: phosphonate C-P lyase system protein PhnH [Actinomycetota bacterium]